MIPQRLVLKNFLSYQNLDLDLTGIRAACIWGANGAGKSSLLEAMIWSLWGKSRAASEEDLIHTGALEAQVRFRFVVGETSYQVCRTRSRGGGSTMEFQVVVGDRLQSLTGKGLRATQQLIIDRLKLDYDTFLNSAYLRQGRADEFMLRRPAERKQILAEILGLNECDRLAEKARDVARQCKGEIQALERQQSVLQKQAQTLQTLLAEMAAVTEEWQALQAAAERDRQHLQTLSQQEQQRQQCQQTQAWCRQRLVTLSQTLQQAIQQQEQLAAQMREWGEVLTQAAAIRAAADRHRAQQELERQYRQQEAQHRHWQERYRALQQQEQTRQNEVLLALRAIAAEQQALQQQQEELNGLLQKSAEIKAAAERAQRARDELREYDRRYSQWQPQERYRQERQRYWDAEEARLRTRLEERQRYANPLPIENLDAEIERLQKLQVYRDRVLEKGMERRDFAQTLATRQREAEQQLARLQNDLARLQQEVAQGGEAYPPCPLCDRPLSQSSWEAVCHKHQAQIREGQSEKWLLEQQQQITAREQEILRQEYRRLAAELKQLPVYLERRGQYQAAQQQQQAREAEIRALEAELAQRLQERDREMGELTAALAALDYDERTHALLRSEVERYRWVDGRLAELAKAQRHTAKLAEQLAQKQAQAETLQAQQHHPQTAAALAACEAALAQIAYNPEAHARLRAACADSTPLLAEQNLAIAERQYPTLRQQSQQLQAQIQTLQHQKQQVEQEEQQQAATLARLPDPAPERARLEAQQAERRQQLDRCLARLGQLQQAEQQWAQLQHQQQEVAQALQRAKHQEFLHRELDRAFGKNGLQVLAVETVLPQLEVEANRLLGQLSDRRLHLRFVTQRGKREDTLDIEIADERGTRPYETYSGGEAFRINFAVRLALARLLAQRKGGQLQTLIVDEGFGSQDAEGCDRLVAALNAIADEFACILVVTHLPRLRDTFPTVLEVSKTAEGSQVVIHH
ncbi:MAG: AAA family ATPase [Pseudanabaenaceae cyanobacterium]